MKKSTQIQNEHSVVPVNSKEQTHSKLALTTLSKIVQIIIFPG